MNHIFSFNLVSFDIQYILFAFLQNLSLSLKYWYLKINQWKQWKRMESLTFTFTFSSTNLAQKRAVDFSKGSLGSRGFSCHVSSMYSRMTRDSATGFPFVHKHWDLLMDRVILEKNGTLVCQVFFYILIFYPLELQRPFNSAAERTQRCTNHFHFSHSELYRIWIELSINETITLEFLDVASWKFLYFLERVSSQVRDWARLPELWMWHLEIFSLL